MSANPKKAAVKGLEEAKSFEKYCPVSGKKLGDYPITDKAGVEQAVARARAASKTWGKRSLSERMEFLGRLRGIIRENGEDYARRISEDTGKPLVDSLMTELMSIPLFIDYYEKTAAKVLGRKKVRTPILFPGKKSYVEHFPMGVIGVISPWNFPFQLSMVPVISALIGGNTVVLKPSEVTPITGDLIAEIFKAARFPQGVVEVIQGDGTTGAALAHADIDKIFFTGSVATGRKVMAAAATKPIPVELELGGKDAMIVCADANLERAAKAAVWGGFINCGQMCISVERLFVVDAVHDAFIALVKAEIARMKVGGPEEHADMGPMTFPLQIATVERHVEDARARGARIATGGRRIEGDGQFFEPTLVLDVTEEMEIYREETFGPVLPVIRVANEEEAVRMANDHQYGLTGSVWTQDHRRGLELASQLECGQANVNDLVVSVGNPVLPFGGVKNSGFGRYHGPEGLLGFVHQKAIMIDRGWFNTEPFWFPYAGKYPHMFDAFEGLLTNNLPRALKAMLKLRGIK